MMLVQFGAGNIGRSFIGQIFSGAGWEVVFIDIDERIVQELTRRGQYKVEVRDKQPRTIVVRNVRGVSGHNLEQVSSEVCEADLVSTAVGKGALPHIMEPISIGLLKRIKKYPDSPLDIVICENMRDAASYFRESLRTYLPPNFPLDENIGFIETSIGKMVPIISEQERERNPLTVYAEAYNTLIVDKKGFKNRVPDIPNLDPKENIKAYVDRKLFIHNMGHAVLSYISFVFEDGYQYVWEAADDDNLRVVTKNAMRESGAALIEEYPDDFNKESIHNHIEDIIARFRNRTLGDTIYRAGRDLYRKLGPDDRLIGSIKLCMRRGVEPKHIALGTAAALFFRASDQEGKIFEKDGIFHERESVRGLDHVLKNISGLYDEKILSLIRGYYNRIRQGNRDIKNFQV